jgi:hypothetical protein
MLPAPRPRPNIPNPIHWLSGEKKGLKPLAASGSSRDPG